MSPKQVFPPESGPRNPIAQRVLDNPNLTFDVDADGIVIAVKRELVVRRSARESSPLLDRELSKVARNCGTLASISAAPPTNGFSSLAARVKAAVHVPDRGGPAADVEIWRLLDETADSIDQARRLRRYAPDEFVKTRKGPPVLVAAVSPNHVTILCPKAGGCPASPPVPAPPPPGVFIEPSVPTVGPRVTVLDSGYIHVAPPNPPHAALDERVTLVDGLGLNTSVTPATWQPDIPDGLYLDALGELDGITGHGTFIAGLIANICPQARLTVVGLRDQEVDILPLSPSEQSGLFETEVAIAYAMMQHCDTDVIQCGFAFPTLDDYASLPFLAAMEVINGPGAPREGVAVVAPAGNEVSRRRYWPAALPDVIGVASTNRYGNAPAWFSNWGDWCDCATRGENVRSTFVYWNGPIQGEPVARIEEFDGWAWWDGTSFAAPKISAAIARVLADADDGLLPIEAWELIVAGRTPVPVAPVTDYALSPFPGVTLPNIELG